MEGSLQGADDGSAESLFVAYIARVEAGEAADLEGVCSAHPELADELRRLEAQWGALQGLLSNLRLKSEIRLVEAGPRLNDEGPTLSFLRRLRTRRDPSQRYERKSKLGQGGFGEVLEVVDTDLERTLAMKTIRNEYAPLDAKSVDPQILTRFLEEAQITGQLDHPGVVPIHEVGVSADGQVYYTMRVVQGDNLHKVFEDVRAGRNGRTLTGCIEILARVCETMAYAHTKKRVIHRDVKPANVMVGEFGEVYVVDWGLARWIDRASASQSDAGAVRTVRRRELAETPDAPVRTIGSPGTPEYMAPEQARLDATANLPQCDIYSVGAMLYELISGRAPYRRERESRPTDAERLSRVIAGPPDPVEELAARAAPELIAVCNKAMERDLTHRYRTMKELGDDLRAFLEVRVVGAYETGTWAEARKWVQRNKALAASLAAAVLAIAIGGGAFAVKAKEATDARDGLASKNIELKSTNSALEKAKSDALASEQRAQLARVEAEKTTDEVLSLSAQKDLDDMVARAEKLWPAHPDMIEEYEAWLKDARELIDGRPEDQAKGVKKRPSLREHKAKLAELRSKGRPQPAEATDTEHADGEHRTFDYDDPQASWWDVQLARLVADLEALRDPTTGLMGSTLAEPFGWGVTKRYEFAKSIEERSVSGPEANRLWDEAVAAIKSSPKYGGLVITPQLGLRPIGVDPASGLWEFAHLQTGDPPERGADQRLVLTESMGLVFVLIPGGQFWMGAQTTDKDGQNYDPLAAVDESPVHEVALSAYFLSKYEMTQGQWQRVAARNPSYYQPHAGIILPLLHPVEQVSWFDSLTLMERLACALPSEAQWENGARGGTDTPWWTGQDRESLRGRVNLADQTAKRAGATWSDLDDWPDLEDGGAEHTEAGRYAANGFGLHEVAGNVWEWCRDDFDPNCYAQPYGKDPVSLTSGSASRVTRGGGLSSKASSARSADRDSSAPDFGYDVLGLRPARAISTN